MDDVAIAGCLEPPVPHRRARGHGEAVMLREEIHQPAGVARRESTSLMAVSTALNRRLWAWWRLATTSGATPPINGNGPGGSELSNWSQTQGARPTYWSLRSLSSIFTSARREGHPLLREMQRVPGVRRPDPQD